MGHTTYRNTVTIQLNAYVMGRRSTEHYWIILWSGVGRIIFFWMWIRPERWWSTSEGRRRHHDSCLSWDRMLMWRRSAKYPGIYIDSRLNWNTNRETVHKKGGWTGSTPNGSWDPSVCAGKRWSFFFLPVSCVQCSVLYCGIRENCLCDCDWLQTGHLWNL